jgi:hypothetical protein
MLHTAPPKGIELAVLVSANLIATGVRFLLMRIWVFRATRTPATVTAG